MLKSMSLTGVRQLLSQFSQLPMEHLRIAKPFVYQLKELYNVSQLDWSQAGINDVATIGMLLSKHRTLSNIYIQNYDFTFIYLYVLLIVSGCTAILCLLSCSLAVFVK